MPTQNTLLSLNNPSIALLTSIITYPLIFISVTPRNASASRFTKSREAISVLHCTFVTLLSAWELRAQSSHWNTHRPSPINGDEKSANGASCPLITTSSVRGNSIMAYELGYLVQDSVILVLAARLRAQEGPVRRLVKEINWRVLGWHHVGLSSALALLQWYIARGREKGIMVILMLMLMNAS
jgi:hypothetical protein